MKNKQLGKIGKKKQVKIGKKIGNTISTLFFFFFQDWLETLYLVTNIN